MMVTAHLAFFSLFARLRRNGRDVTQSVRPRRRLLSVLRQTRWQQAPPTDRLSNHLRRDIGLPYADDRGWLDERSLWRNRR